MIHLSPHHFITLSLFLIRQIIQMLDGFIGGGATVQVGDKQFCLIKEIFSVQMWELGAIVGAVFVHRAQPTLTIQKLTRCAVVANVTCGFLDI